MKIYKLAQLTGDLLPFSHDRPDSSEIQSSVDLYNQLKEERDELSRQLTEAKQKLNYVGINDRYDLWQQDPVVSELYRKHYTAERALNDLYFKVNRLIYQGATPSESYSDKNPDQEHYTAGTGHLQPLDQAMIGDWTSSCMSRHFWYALASEEYGINLRRLLLDTLYTRNDQGWHSPFPTIQHGWKREANLPKNIDSLVSMWEQGQIHEDHYSGKNKIATKKAISKIRDEAKKTLGSKPIIVYRGMPLPYGVYQNLTKSILTSGYYVLKTLPLASFTTDLRLAKSFAKFGEGGKQRSKNLNKGNGIVFSQVATQDNIWMHYKQPTFAKAVEGVEFHIGSTTQREVVLGFPDAQIVLTKDNMIVPEWVNNNGLA